MEHMPKCLLLLHICISAPFWIFSPAVHTQKKMHMDDKSPSISVAKVTIISQRHRQLISVGGRWQRLSIGLSKKPDYFLLPSNSRFVSFALCLSTVNVFWMVGWLFLALKGRKFTDRMVQQIQKNARHLKSCSSKQLKMNRLVITLLRHQNITLKRFDLPAL